MFKSTLLILVAVLSCKAEETKKTMSQPASSISSAASSVASVANSSIASGVQTSSVASSAQTSSVASSVQASSVASSIASASRTSIASSKTTSSANAKASTDKPLSTSGDYAKVKVWHNPPKPNDPVVVKLGKPTSKTSKILPSNITKSSATLVVPIAPLSSGNKGRDKHIKSSDLLDAAKFGQATIAINNISKKGKGYAAKAKVSFRGKAKTISLPFTVVESNNSGIRIKTNGTIKLSDFGVADAGGSIGQKVSLEAQVTLNK